MSTLDMAPAAVNLNAGPDEAESRWLRNHCCLCGAEVPPERSGWVATCYRCEPAEAPEPDDPNEPPVDPVSDLDRAWLAGYNAARRELLGDDTPVIVPPVTSANVCDCDAYGLGPCPRCLAALAAE